MASLYGRTKLFFLRDWSYLPMGPLPPRGLFLPLFLPLVCPLCCCATASLYESLPSRLRGVEAGEAPAGVRLREGALLGRLGGGRLAKNSANAGLGGGTEHLLPQKLLEEYHEVDDHRKEITNPTDSTSRSPLGLPT